MPTATYLAALHVGRYVEAGVAGDTRVRLFAPPALRRDASGKLQPAAPLVNGDPS